MLREIQDILMAKQQKKKFFHETIHIQLKYGKHSMDEGKNGEEEGEERGERA